MLELMYITNDLEVAKIAEKNGVGRIWIDLETLNKEQRQKNMNTVKSKHSIEDIKKIAPNLKKSKMLARVNPWNYNSIKEINEVIDAGAELIMLPMWKSVEEVKKFIDTVNGRVKTVLLLETKEAVECLEEVLELKGIDEIHIGLNDLHISYGLTFMFELLSNGVVENICNKISKTKIKYGFGGIAKIGEGDLPAENIIIEHYRLGSTRAILSRSFCNTENINDLKEIDNIFQENTRKLRKYEDEVLKMDSKRYEQNKKEINEKVREVVRKKRNRDIYNVNAMNILKEKFGDAFYVLDTKQFRSNFLELKSTFSKNYSKFNIAYSYKTNYTPELCKIVNELGGIAEVVSEMELQLALKIGVEPSKIIWNGPVKNYSEMKKFLLSGGIVNVDSIEEMDSIKEIAINTNKNINIGIRCNYDANDGVVSRFGVDIDGADFLKILETIKNIKNIKLVSLQSHFAKRQIDFWKARAEGMLRAVEKVGIIPEFIDLGGGIFGKMEQSLKSQFDYYIPNYEDYANIVGPVFDKYFLKYENKPTLLIEPGTALVGDCMKFVGTVKTIKNIRGKYFASILGSQKNINMTGVKPPIQVINTGENQKEYTDIDLVGYTCIESDTIYSNYSGMLAREDTIIISNCGSYSLVMKPPFILPNFPVIDVDGDKVKIIKEEENFKNIFSTYIF